MNAFFDKVIAKFYTYVDENFLADFILMTTIELIKLNTFRVNVELTE